MQLTHKSQVTAVPAATCESAQAFFAAKLEYETDCADVFYDYKHDITDYIILDVRSVEAYAKSHLPHALNLPNAQITASALADYPDDTLFIVYCWGPGCNGATKAAHKISKLGYSVKEMIGGIEYWEDRERYPVVRGV